MKTDMTRHVDVGLCVWAKVKVNNEWTRNEPSHTLLWWASVWDTLGGLNYQPCLREWALNPAHSECKSHLVGPFFPGSCPNLFPTWAMVKMSFQLFFYFRWDNVLSSFLSTQVWKREGEKLLQGDNIGAWSGALASDGARLVSEQAPQHVGLASERPSNGSCRSGRPLRH
jgi:hypothetical protein